MAREVSRVPGADSVEMVATFSIDSETVRVA
jgi:hypothetical protein